MAINVPDSCVLLTYMWLCVYNFANMNICICLLHFILVSNCNCNVQYSEPVFSILQKHFCNQIKNEMTGSYLLNQLFCVCFCSFCIGSHACSVPRPLRATWWDTSLFSKQIWPSESFYCTAFLRVNIVYSNLQWSSSDHFWDIDITRLMCILISNLVGLKGYFYSPVLLYLKAIAFVYICS